MDTEKKYREFPINILPPLLKNIITETHKALNFPVSYIGMSLLTAIATAIGDTCWLKVKRKRKISLIRRQLFICGIQMKH